MDQPASTFHLLTINGESYPRNIVLEKKQYSIGRNSDNLIMIQDLAISRYHCTIFPVQYKNAKGKEGGAVVFWVIDGDTLGNRSSNGLFVNGDRCYSHELKSGDTITFLGTDTHIQYTIASSSQELTNPQVTIPPQMVSPSQTVVPTSPKEKSETTVISQDTILTDLLDDVFRALSYQQSSGQTSSAYEYYVLETNLAGHILSYDEAFQGQFPLLIESFGSHPFTKFLQDDVMDSEAGTAIRKVKYRRKFYTQYARLDLPRQIIKSYIFDFAVANQVDTIRESEERYRAILRQVSQGILVVEPQTLKIIEANPAYYNLVGYSAADIVQLTLPDLIPGDRHVLASLLESILNARRELSRESVHRHQDGTLIEVEEDISLIGYSSHKIICFAVKDITQRKKTERELHQSVTEKELLLKEIHHRVKNNLLIVSSLLDWRSESIDDPAIQSIFSESQRRIDTIALIHEKLYGTKDLAQIDLGDYLETLAMQIFESFSIKDKNISRIKLEFDLSPIFLNIETAMPCGLIVNELLLNTFKHAFPDQRGGTVNLSLKSQSNDSYLLVVKDDGVGFPPDFDFTQAESLGWQLINLLTDQLDGLIRIKEGDDTRIELLFAKQNYNRRL